MNSLSVWMSQSPSRTYRCLPRMHLERRCSLQDPVVKFDYLNHAEELLQCTLYLCYDAFIPELNIHKKRKNYVSWHLHAIMP